MRRLSQAHISVAQRMAVAMLLLCMALAQSLSLAHRTLHHDLRMLAHTHEEQLLANESAHASAAGHSSDCDHGFFSRLFADHEEGEETCRLMQGASSFLGLNSPPALIFPAQGAHLFIATSAPALAAWQAPLFEARGPPAHSL